MNTDHQKILLHIARKSIEGRLYKMPFEISPEVKKQPSFAQKKGCFVTLTQEGALRGCIGNIDPVYPLAEAVQRNAISAAFHDPRFQPISTEDLQKISIEISVLSIPVKVEFENMDDLIDKVTPYKDGVIFQYGSHTATFLPQVWSELPSHEEFFRHLSFKAGLEPTFWKHNPQLQVFTYQVEKFEEA
jgi:uncharacterized protein